MQKYLWSCFTKLSQKPSILNRTSPKTNTQVETPHGELELLQQPQEPPKGELKPHRGRDPPEEQTKPLAKSRSPTNKSRLTVVRVTLNIFSKLLSSDHRFQKLNHIMMKSLLYADNLSTLIHVTSHHWRTAAAPHSLPGPEWAAGRFQAPCCPAGGAEARRRAGMGRQPVGSAALRKSTEKNHKLYDYYREYFLKYFKITEL